MVARSIILDAIYTIFDKDYSWKRKLLWLTLNPFYQIEKWRGIRLGAMADLSNDEQISKNSLESRQRIERGE